MKKTLLVAAAALLMAGTASAQWAVVGSYSNPSWNFAASTTFTGEGDNLSCKIEYLTGDFKIVDITNNNWDVQYGTATPIEINKSFVLDAKNGGPDPSNMKFAGLIQAVKNATVNWNPSTATMEIVAAESDLVIAYPTLYATGSFCGWNGPGEGNSVLCTENNGIYTVKINLGDAEKTEFKLAGSGWSNEIAGGVEVGTEAVKVTKGGDNLYTTLTGEQTLTFNYNTMLMTFGDPADVTPETSDRIWAVVGAYTDPNWNFAASTILTGDGDNLSCTIDKLTNDFKIVDITDNNWDTAYGMPKVNGVTEKLVVNTPTVLTKDDGQNITFANLVQVVNNATVKWNPTTATLEIVAAESDIEIAYPTLYATGAFCNWNSPGEGESVLCKEENGIYTVTIDLGDAAETEFKLAGPGWSNEIAGGVEVGLEAVTVTFGGSNLKTTLTGEQTLTFNYNTMQMTFGPSDLVSGVQNVNVEETAAPEYYTISGVRVAAPEKGLYIVRQGSKVSKVIF